MTIKLSLLATALLLAAPVAAQQPTAAPSTNDYDNPATWLCRPGHEAVCTTDQRATVVRADGTTTTRNWKSLMVCERDCEVDLLVALHGMRNVRRFEPGHFVGGQPDL